MADIIKHHRVGISKHHRRKGMFECSTPKEFLELVFLSGGIIAALAISPALLVPAILIKTARAKPNVRNAFRNAYTYVRRQELIKVASDMDGSQKFILTQKGKVLALRYHTERIFMERKKGEQYWDKFWRIFIFDIPSLESNKRNALRHFIKRLGMIQLQKSAWVYPYDCSNELKFIKEIFSLSDDNARLVVSSDIGNDKKLREHFLLPI